MGRRRRERRAASVCAAAADAAGFSRRARRAHLRRCVTFLGTVLGSISWCSPAAPFECCRLSCCWPSTAPGGVVHALGALEWDVLHSQAGTNVAAASAY